MTDTSAPERIWRSSPWSASGYNAGLASWPVKEHASPNATEYTRTDTVEARIAELTAERDALKAKVDDSLRSYEITGNRTQLIRALYAAIGGRP